jgi:hypothetical protein
LRGDQPGSDRQGESVVAGVTRYLVADRGTDLLQALGWLCAQDRAGADAGAQFRFEEPASSKASVGTTTKSTPVNRSLVMCLLVSRIAWFLLSRTFETVRGVRTLFGRARGLAGEGGKAAEKQSRQHGRQHEDDGPNRGSRAETVDERRPRGIKATGRILSSPRTAAR